MTFVHFLQESQFKHSVLRIDNGLKQCDELMASIKERAHVEEQYGKSLLEWSTKHQKVD